MNDKKEIFETMPVPKALATLAIPTIISQLISMIYNLADTFFLGMTNDPYKVAAASLASVLSFGTAALANLFSIGGGSLISRLMGQKKDEDVKDVCAFSIYGCILIAGTYSLIAYIFQAPILTLIGTSENTVYYTSQYLFWVVAIGAIPSALSMTLSNILRSEGYAKQASFGLAMGGILNMILDPMFMFVILPSGMEVTGAATATMLSNVTSMVYFLSLFVRLRGEAMLSLSPRAAASGSHYIVQILAVGFPSALNSMLACISNLLVNKMTAAYGDIPVAAMGIVKKIDMLPMNVSMGLCQGMMPLVAYNYASKNYERMKSVTDCARACGVIFAGICIVVFELFAGPLVSLFIREEATLAMGTTLLRLCCLAVPVMITNLQMNYTFQAMGKGRQSLLLSACRQGLIHIPMMFIMNHFWHLYGLVLSQLVSDAITVCIAFALYRSVHRSLVQALEEELAQKQAAGEVS